MDIVEHVFLGRDNLIKVELSDPDTGALARLDGVTRVVIELVGSYHRIDSKVNSEAVDWWTQQGVLTLHLGLQNLPRGIYPIRITLFDEKHRRGLPVIHEGDNPRLLLNIRSSFS